MSLTVRVLGIRGAIHILTRDLFFCFSFYRSGSRFELLIPSLPPTVFHISCPCCFLAQSALPILLQQTHSMNIHRGVPSPRNPSEPWPGLRVPFVSSQQHLAEKTNGVLRLPWLHPWQTSLMDHDAVIQRTLLGLAGTACLHSTKRMIKSDSGSWSWCVHHCRLPRSLACPAPPHPGPHPVT